MTDNTQDRPRQTGDVTRTDTNASSGDRASLPVEAEVMPSPLQRIAASRSQANLHPLGDAGRRNEALGGTYDPPATRMATNGMTSIEESPLTPLVGLGLTNSTSKEEEGSSKRLSFQVKRARVLLSPSWMNFPDHIASGVSSRVFPRCCSRRALGKCGD